MQMTLRNSTTLIKTKARVHGFPGSTWVVGCLSVSAAVSALVWTNIDTNQGKDDNHIMRTSSELNLHMTLPGLESSKTPGTVLAFSFAKSGHKTQPIKLL